MKLFFQICLLLLSTVSLLLSLRMMFRVKAPPSPALWGIKMFVSALSPLLLAATIITLVLALLIKYYPAALIATLGAFVFLIHIICITRPPQTAYGFEQAFGPDWKRTISPDLKKQFLPKRYVVFLPSSPEPVFQQNLVYYTIPGSDRTMLCDIWQPPESVTRSGLAFIYVHGSKWYYLTKDIGTRPFFRHLAEQGHVIMDITYRLYPETDFTGMVHDVKHAIAWMKANANQYGVDSQRIVVGGGSAGAHVSMLAAYTADSKQLTPADLTNVDTRVRGVISMYGPPDLSKHYYHTGLNILPPLKRDTLTGKPPAAFPPWIQKKMGDNYHRLGFDKDPEKGMVNVFLDGTPEEKPEAYAMFSPVTYVHNHCPPTLLIQGSHDIVTPVDAFEDLANRLKEVKVPVIMHILPQADHAFDLIMPKTNPGAHNCFYDVERFLALMN